MLVRMEFHNSAGVIDLQDVLIKISLIMRFSPNPIDMVHSAMVPAGCYIPGSSMGYLTISSLVMGLCGENWIFY